MADADAFGDDAYEMHTGQPVNHGQSWSTREENLLVGRLRAKWPIEAIANVHGRSVYAIECRIEAIADRPEREKRVKAAIAKILKGGKAKRK